MRYVSAGDAKHKLAALLDAAQREPVMIRRAEAGCGGCPFSGGV